MKKNLLSFVFALAFAGAFANDNSILVTPHWLNEHLTDANLVVVQVNFLQLDYNKEHIPGARYLWPELMAPNSPEANYNLPHPDKAAEVLRTLGINNNSHVVLYHARGEVSVMARVFLTLENLGLKGQLYFLNGGLDAWVTAGYPVTAEVPDIQRGNFTPKLSALVVDKQYVENTLKSSKAVVVDARMKRFYDGEPTGNPRDGHITGSKNIPYTDLIDQQNMFKPMDSLQRYFEPVANKDQEIVTYCFIGQTACVVYMAGRMLGYNIKLYDNSLQEWSRQDHLPMEKTKE